MIARFYGGPLHAETRVLPDDCRMVQCADVPPMKLWDTGYDEQPMQGVSYTTYVYYPRPVANAALIAHNEDNEACFYLS